MLKKSAAVAGLLFALSPFAASAQEFTPFAELPAGVYHVDKSHASLIWKVSHAGLSNYTARFKSFDATVNLDPKDVTKSSVTATIDPTSVETDYVATAEKDFNKNLATQEQWFNAGKFPTITFKSTKVEKTGENTGKVHGDLTFLGVTKPAVLDVTFNGGFAEQPFSKLPTLGFSGKTVIKRSDWGLTTYVPMIGDDVTIEIEAEFNQPKKG
ncbi:MAG: polyisoprenoid-binding protein [Alphaproteobacteria bacterium]|nr:polyisoprenoid-binding protein [Alphaproteobacteria bacterium]